MKKTNSLEKRADMNHSNDCIETAPEDEDIDLTVPNLTLALHSDGSLVSPGDNDPGRNPYDTDLSTPTKVD